MEKKIYFKPEIETLKMEGCQLLAGSGDEDEIGKSNTTSDISPDSEGFYQAE